VGLLLCRWPKQYQLALRFACETDLGHPWLFGQMSLTMRLRTFLQLTTVFLIGTLLGLLILVLHLPRTIERVLGFIETTITIATMWALRAKAESSDVGQEDQR
jgi:hypothetical protein